MDQIHKFPRTPHLRDSACATHDDIILDAKSATDLLKGPVLCEEKIDGSNLGLHFSDDWTLVTQHRGHSINPLSEAQYSKLQHWIEVHAQELKKILGQKFVLFGEWMAARHSISYNKLPDWFLAFDIMEKATGRFVSRDVRTAMLADSDIWQVNAIGLQQFGSLDEVAAFCLLQQSSYSSREVPIEGIYLRIEQDGWLIKRAKFVDPKFKQAIDDSGKHWSKGPLEWNAVRPDIWVKSDVLQFIAPAAAATTDGGLELKDCEKGAAIPQAAASSGQALGRPTQGLCYVRGTLVLAGTAIDTMAAVLLEKATFKGVEIPEFWLESRRSRDGEHYHITVLSKPEVQLVLSSDQGPQTKAELLQDLTQQVDCRDWLAMGVGQCGGSGGGKAIYGIIIWPSLTQARSRMGLEARAYHITLGFPRTDPQGVDKGLATLIGTGPLSPIHPDPSPSPQSTALQTASTLLVEAMLAMDSDPSLGRTSFSQPQPQHLAGLLLDCARNVLQGVLPQGETEKPLPEDNKGKRPIGEVLHGGVQDRVSRAVGLLGGYIAAAEARWHGLQGDVSAAENAAACAIAAEPSLLYAHMLLAKALLHQARPEEALAVLHNAPGLCSQETEKAPEPETSAVAASRPSPVDEFTPMLDRLHGYFLGEVNLAALAKVLRLAERQTAEQQHSRGLGAVAAGFAEGMVDPRIRVTVPAGLGGLTEAVLLPRNVSFLVPGRLLGGSTPKSREHILGFQALGVRLVVTLTEEEPLPAAWFENTTVANVFVPVPNEHPLTVQQTDSCLTAIERCIGEGGAVMVHCGGGKGRAGTLLASYMCAHGLEIPETRSPLAGPSQPVMAADAAIKLLRKMRPGSIETQRQSLFVREYSTVLWKRSDKGSLRNAAGVHGMQASALPTGYPKTPHLPFSPQVADDDTQLRETACSNFVNSNVIITEKLDGGNCCICDGKVYARTHKQEASHASFDRIKQMVFTMSLSLPTHLALFGECMAAIHSISYDRLTSPLYIFAAFDCQKRVWLSWEAVKQVAESVGCPTVPILFSGSFPSLEAIRIWMSQQAAVPSDVGPGAPREGFVIRSQDQFGEADFEHYVAKYVRKGHIQTDDTWRRTWKPAKIVRTPIQPEESSGQSESAPSAASDVSGDGKEEVGPQKKSGGTAGAPVKPVKLRLPWRLLLLVGLPGSGKSTFAEALEKRSGGAWTRVCQDDEGGSRSACETLFQHLTLRPSGGGKTRVILDRCSVTAKDRKAWVNLAMTSKREVAVVFFDTPKEVCIERVAGREEHPTIRFGQGARVVTSFAKELEPPAVSEGFDRVFVVHSHDEAERVLLAMGAAAN